MPAPSSVSVSPPDTLPTQAEFGIMVAKLALLGVTGPELAATITAQKSRRENAKAIKAFLKTRPKAK